MPIFQPQPVRLLAFAVSLLLGLIFVVAGVSKLIHAPPDPRTAAQPQLSLADEMLPPGSPLRYALVVGEVALGAWLILGVWRRAALGATITLLLGFTVILTLELLSDDPRWCGCVAIVTPDYTISPRQQLVQSMVRNAVMMAAAVWLWFVSPTRSPRA